MGVKCVLDGLFLHDRSGGYRRLRAEDSNFGWHCINDPRYADREIHEDVAPVYDRQEPTFGPIGYVRYFKDPEGSIFGHPTKDYMIIELVAGVTLSAQGPYLKQIGELEVPSGVASPNALNPPMDNERLLGAAWFNNNELVVSGQLGVWYGRITDNRNGTYQSWAQIMAGDSGGPAIWHVPGSAYRPRRTDTKPRDRGLA